jgi:hypothetical protein
MLCILLGIAPLPKFAQSYEVNIAKEILVQFCRDYQDDFYSYIYLCFCAQLVHTVLLCQNTPLVN